MIPVCPAGLAGLSDPAPVIHIAIVHPRFANPILSGAKSVEARLSRVRCAPFNRVHPADRLYFKAAGGGFFATALVERVWRADGLSPPEVRALRDRLEPLVQGGRAFWSARRDARFGTFIWLTKVETVGSGPVLPPPGPGRSRAGWHVLSESADVYPMCLVDAPAGPRLAAGV